MIVGVLMLLGMVAGVAVLVAWVRAVERDDWPPPRE